MSWKRDLNRAQKMSESEPREALALLEGVRPDALAHFHSGATQTPGDVGAEANLYELKATLEDRLGESAAAATDRQRVTELRERELAQIDDEIAKERTWSGVAMWLAFKAVTLEQLGRQIEADRCTLAFADATLAGIGDQNAKVNFEAAGFGSSKEGGVETSAGFALGSSVNSLIGGGNSGAFRKGWESQERLKANTARDPIIDAGRGLGLARCESCGGAVEANYHANVCREGHKVDGVRVVVKDDEASVREELSRAAWRPDPTRRHQHRYWDGERWTDDVADAGRQSVDSAEDLKLPAAWRPDPAGRHGYRYWDGEHWTDEVADAGKQSVEPYSPPKAPAAS
jgi:hypothetical protein